MMKKKYELMAIVRGSIPDQEIEERLKAVKELLGSEIVFEERWGLRPLAYRIKKESKGSYVVFNFMMEADQISELESNLRLMPDLVRFLLISVPENYQPMKLSEIEAGLEKLSEEKAKKRGEKRSAESASPGAPMMRKEGFKEEKVMEEKKTEKPLEKPMEQKKEETKEKKTFDQKLEDILSDDSLGL